MANFSTWSGSFGGTAAGTNGKDTTLTLSSGRALTSSDQIKNITFTLRITCSRYSSSKTWDLHWFAVDSSTGSPYANPTSTAMSATEHTFSGAMEFDASDIWKFFYDEITVYAKANTTHSYTSYMREATITVEYETASLTTPGTPIVEQSSFTGKCTISWTASTVVNGTGTITYTVFYGDNNDNWYVLADNTESTQLENVRIPGYGQFGVEVVASCFITSDQELMSVSSIGYYTIQPPSLGELVFSLSPASGDSTVLTWSNPTISYGEASKYTYIIKYSTAHSMEVEYKIIETEFTGTMQEMIPSSFFEYEAEDGDLIIFDLTIQVSIKDAIEGYGYDILETTANSKEFIYDGAYTVGYYTDSGWQPCRVYCYTDAGWKECIPYYYNNSTWVPIKTKI